MTILLSPVVSSSIAFVAGATVTKVHEWLFCLKCHSLACTVCCRHASIGGSIIGGGVGGHSSGSIGGSSRSNGGSSGGASKYSPLPWSNYFQESFDVTLSNGDVSAAVTATNAATVCCAQWWYCRAGSLSARLPLPSVMCQWLSPPATPCSRPNRCFTCTRRGQVAQWCCACTGEATQGESPKLKQVEPASLLSAAILLLPVAVPVKAMQAQRLLCMRPLLSQGPAPRTRHGCCAVQTLLRSVGCTDNITAEQGGRGGPFLPFFGRWRPHHSRHGPSRPRAEPHC